MTETDPPTTRPSAVHENPLVAALKRAEAAEKELQRVQVKLATLRPLADRPPLSRRIVETVRAGAQAASATPRLVQWAALLTAIAALLGATTATVRVLVDAVKVQAQRPPN